MKIFVDADACPVRSEIERIALKRSVTVVHVCALAEMKRESEGVEIVFLPAGPDAVDDWIVERAGAGDIVVTYDIPLAAAAVRRGGVVIEFRGRELTPGNIGDRLQARNASAFLRDHGIHTSGPSPFTKTDRKNFSSKFAEILDREIRKSRVPANEERQNSAALEGGK